MFRKRQRKSILLRLFPCLIFLALSGCQGDKIKTTCVVYAKDPDIVKPVYDPKMPPRRIRTSEYKEYQHKIVCHKT